MTTSFEADTQMHSRPTVASVVQCRLCVGCGTCVVVCRRRAITMVERLPGFLIAEINSKACHNCGLCLDVCPGWQLYAMDELRCKDPFRGHVIKAFVGCAKGKGVRCGAQSGGIATALLIGQLRSGQIDQALVCGMPANGPLRPIPRLVVTEKELMASQGSLYCPVSLNAKLLDADDVRLAVVALPCHVHGLDNLRRKVSVWRKRIALTVGLVCDRTLHFSAMDYLIGLAGADRSNVLSFRYKDKSRGDFPGNIIVQLKDGRVLELAFRHRLACKDAFTPLHCRFCFDKTNVLSDIVLGDAWGIREDKQGFSIVLARTENGIKALHDARNSGLLELEEIDPERVFTGQVIDKRKKDLAAYAKAWRGLGRELPAFLPTDTMADSLVTRKDTRNANREIRWAEELANRAENKDVIQAVKKRIAREILYRKISRFAPRRVLNGIVRRMGLENLI